MDLVLDSKNDACTDGGGAGDVTCRLGDSNHSSESPSAILTRPRGVTSEARRGEAQRASRARDQRPPKPPWGGPPPPLGS